MWAWCRKNVQFAGYLTHSGSEFWDSFQTIVHDREASGRVVTSSPSDNVLFTSLFIDHITTKNSYKFSSGRAGWK